MKIRVLGAAAGGGFPQWNCGCPNCIEVRSGSGRTEARTQDSLAVTADGERWTLINASPDILKQIEQTPALHPRRPRHSPVEGIVLTNGDMDHILGLFSLRESYPLNLYATRPVWEGLSTQNAMFKTLQRFPEQITWHELQLGKETALPGGISVTPFAVPGKLPVHLEKSHEPTAEDSIGLVVAEGATRVVYCGAAGALGPFTARFADAACLLFDGTFWSSDELVRLGLSKARAESMAHLPIGGEHGSLKGFADLRVGRRIFTHINNTNPILIRGSVERTLVETGGWEVAYDGMEIVP